MEIRDYLRMLRHGWLTIVPITVLFIGVAAAYLALAPKHYDAMAVLFVSTARPVSISDLQQGSQFARTQAVTYAQVIDSVTVLGPVASELRPQRGVDELVDMVTATVRPETSLIDINVTGTDRDHVAIVANAVGQSAVNVIPQLDRTAGGRSLVRIQQIRDAVEPVRAASPNAKRTLALGFVVDLAVGLATTIIFQTLDNRIHRVQEVRQLADVPLLAALPRLRRGEHRGLILRDKPSSDIGEAFRALRTNISFLEQTELRSLLVSAVANERDGALVPVNLAWALAQTGQRTLLVDLDLRRSTVGEIFGLVPNAGISDVLVGQSQLVDVIHSTDHPYLSVVLSGSTHPSPSELLSSPDMASVLHWMERHYDRVIVHAPPLLSYSDAVVASATVGGTLVTVAAGSTQAQHLTTALLTLANVRVKPLGLVLTQVHNSTLDTFRVKSGQWRFGARSARREVQPLWVWDEEGEGGSEYEPARASGPDRPSE